MLGLDGLGSLAVSFGGVGALIISIFGLGYGLNKKIKAAAKDEVKELVDNMTILADKLNKLEQAHVPIGRYERDLLDVKDLIKEVHADVKNGLNTLSSRIDALMTSKV